MMAVDWLLHSLPKQVKWTWPDEFGEDKYLIMFGGLYIEMAAFWALGTWLQDSGWVQALVKQNIPPLKLLILSSHLKKTGHAHEVTVGTLSIVKHKAGDVYVQVSPEVALTFQDWDKKSINSYPHFQYWNITLELELTAQLLIRGQRQKIWFVLGSSEPACTMVLALGLTNYARWLPLHIRNLNRNTNLIVIRNIWWLCNWDVSTIYPWDSGKCRVKM